MPYFCTTPPCFSHSKPFFYRNQSLFFFLFLLFLFFSYLIPFAPNRRKCHPCPPPPNSPAPLPLRQVRRRRDEKLIKTFFFLLVPFTTFRIACCRSHSKENIYIYIYILKKFVRLGMHSRHYFPPHPTRGLPSDPVWFGGA